MYTRRTTRKSPRRSPSPKEEVIQRRLRGRRQGTGLRKTKAGDSVVHTDDGGKRDIIDIINSTHAKHAEEDEGKFIEVADEGVEELDEDSSSVSSSIASGPSLLHNIAPKKPRPLQGMCSACQKLYQKAKRMKAPIKNKLLDNDPKSLTCDQWVLKKNWRPRRQSNIRGKLLTHIQLVKKRLQIKNKAKRTVEHVGEGEPSACSRPHTFLQRNLRRLLRVPVKKERKKNRRKRTRDDSQGPRVAKLQRLHSNNHPQHISTGWTVNDSLHPPSGHSGSPGFEECGEQEIDDPASADLTTEFFPSAAPLETTKLKGVTPSQKAQNKTCGFRNLLAQLRGNSSMIVRETR
ncbi:uncharacterized protein si:ch211-227n13.3 isoform X2 [Chelmon rostratus]|nr:uncharacterized protein si:ch211-227n13.3 isoform X2 [Chelmon rostratus]